jgi:hypothetical protein
MRRRSRSTASDGTLEEPLLGGGAGGEGRSVPAPPSPCRALTPWRPAAIFLALWEFLRLEALWRAVAGVLGPLLPPGLRPPPRASARATAAYAGLTSALAARFDPADASHAVSLADLWVASFPDTPPPTPLAPHPLWKEAGWQGDDPRTDLRGGGVAAVRAALHLARTRPGLWARLRHKDRGGPGAYVADLEYPFGAAGVAVAVLTAQACGLLGGRGAVALPPPPGPPKSPGGRGFLRLLDGELSVAAGEDDGGGDDEALAFALWADLAAAAYERLDADWEAGRASYMQFPSLAEGVREDLERALGRRGVASVGDVRAGLGLGR